jgi:hypothetical protein
MVSAMKISSRVAGLVLGLGLPLLSFVSLHVLHPPGRPEPMSDDELAAWARSGAYQLWTGASLGLVTVFLLLAWGVLAVRRLEGWGAPDVLVQVARQGTLLVAALVSVASILQMVAAVVATPSERVGSSTLLPVLVLLGGNVNVAAWCLLAPVGVAAAAAPGAPRWLRLLAGALSVVLVVTLALPFVSWFPGFLLVAVLAVPAVRQPGSQRSGTKRYSPAPTATS